MLLQVLSLSGIVCHGARVISVLRAVIVRNLIRSGGSGPGSFVAEVCSTSTDRQIRTHPHVAGIDGPRPTSEGQSRLSAIICMVVDASTMEGVRRQATRPGCGRHRQG